MMPFSFLSVSFPSKIDDRFALAPQRGPQPYLAVARLSHSPLSDAQPEQRDPVLHRGLAMDI